MTLVVLVALSALLVSANALSISHWDLEGANRTCDGRASCDRGKRDRMGDELDWRERNCLCDSLCAKYGDCCPDSAHFDVTEQRRGAAEFSCIDLRQFGGVYMRGWCPPEWGGSRGECEASRPDPRDPLGSLPVTSHRSGITYTSTHCALCHGETELDVWHPRLECPTLSTQHNVSRASFTQGLEWNEDEGFWGIELEEKWHSCAVDPVIPETSTHIVRRCPTEVVKTCAVNWTNADVRARCEAYTSLVYQGSDTFRNPHCAVCNNIPLQYLQCTRVLYRTHFNKDFSPVAFNILFDLSGGVVGKIKPCGDDELYDPFFKRCRAVLRDVKIEEIVEVVEGTDAPEVLQAEQDLAKHNYTTIAVCPKFVLEKEEFQLENDTVWVSSYSRRFLQGEYLLREDGSVEVCSTGLGVATVDKFGVYMGYVTYAGLGVSVIFLLLHLAATALVSELRNLSGKNLASLCTALLVAYTCFMAGQVLEGRPCFVVAGITYYFFLAAFSWTLTMAFDVWRTLRLATSELRVSAGKQWRKFAVYSAWSWSAPAVIVAAALLVETSPPDAVAPDWRPDFGTHSCWFGRPKALWVFFAAPLAVVMAANLLFFGASARMIYSTTSTTRFTASPGTQRDFRLYARLALVMGLTWSVGLAAGTLDYHILWYVFILLNTLQGLFIFLAFTCTAKVIRALALRRQDSKPLRPPSFSWSSDSTRKSHMGSEHGTTDTLY